LPLKSAGKEWGGFVSNKSPSPRHRPRTINKTGRTGTQVLPRVRRVAALLKRWLLVGSSLRPLSFGRR
jgi:hypothetical protein